MLNLAAFKSSLKASLKEAANANSSNDIDLDKAMENLANAIANEVDSYIKSATITLATKVVQVQGSPSAQTNIAPIIVSNGIS